MRVKSKQEKRGYTDVWPIIYQRGALYSLDLLTIIRKVFKISDPQQIWMFTSVTQVLYLEASSTDPGFIRMLSSSTEAVCKLCKSVEGYWTWMCVISGKTGIEGIREWIRIKRQEENGKNEVGIPHFQYSHNNHIANDCLECNNESDVWYMLSVMNEDAKMKI